MEFLPNGIRQLAHPEEYAMIRSDRCRLPCRVRPQAPLARGERDGGNGDRRRDHPRASGDVRARHRETQRLPRLRRSPRPTRPRSRTAGSLALAYAIHGRIEAGQIRDHADAAELLGLTRPKHAAYIMRLAAPRCGRSAGADHGRTRDQRADDGCGRGEDAELGGTTVGGRPGTPDLPATSLPAAG